MSNDFDFAGARLRVLSVSVALSLTVWLPATQAQVLEEVVVTAQKREQSITDVPIAIQTFGADFVAEQNVFDVTEITQRVPNVQYSESPFTPIVAVRGLGASGGNRGFESQVVLFADGIYGGRPTQFLGPMFDVERVEVVKGPQAVLFGKNATGGVISVTTARPGDEFEGYISGGYEAEYEGWITEGVLSGPITPTLGARVAVRYLEEGGFIRNTSVGRDEPEQESLIARGVLQWTPTDDLNIVAKIEYVETEADGRNEQLECVTPGFTSIEGGPFGNAECIRDDRRSSGAEAGPFFATDNGPQDVSLDTFNFALNADWDIGSHTLSLVTGFSEYDNLNESGTTPDFSEIGLVVGNTADGEFEQWSVEARIASETGGTLEYIVGGFWLDSNEVLSQDFGVALPPGAGPPPIPPPGAVLRKVFDIEQDVEVWSIFGALTWNATDQLSLTAQVRYSEEDKDFEAPIYQVFSPLAFDTTALFTTVDSDRSTLPLLITYDLDRSEEVVDYAFNAKYNFTDDLMVYVSYGKGSKGGGYSFFPIQLSPFPEPPEAIEYEDEEGRSVEGGFKATLLGGRAQLNFAAFYTEYDDMQQVTFDAGRGGFDISNAEEATSIGVEVEGQWLINEQLSVGGSVGYLDAEFDEFPGVDCPAPPFTGACNPLVGQDLDDDPLPFAPDWNLSLYGDYSMAVASSYMLDLHLDANFSDDVLFQIDQDPGNTEDSYWIVNGRIALSPSSERWVLSVQAKNLFDEDDIAVYGADTVVANLPGQAAAGPRMVKILPGRQVYLQARWNF